MEENKETDWMQIRKDLEDFIKIYEAQDKNTDWVDELLSAKNTKAEAIKWYINTICIKYALQKIAAEAEEFEVCALIQKVLVIEHEYIIYLIDRYYGGITEKDSKRIEKINKKTKDIFYN